MRLGKLRLFQIISLLLLVGGMLLCMSLSVESSKYMDKNVFYVSPIVNDNQFFFNLSDIDVIQNKTDQGITLSYEIAGSERVSNGVYQASARIIKTNSEYFKLTNTQFADGFAWPSTMENEHIAVISESLAWKLFGNVNVSGAFIQLANDEYLIAGVIKQNVYTAENYYMWIPSTAGTDQNLPVISKLIIGYNTYNPIESYLTTKSFITDANKSETDYHITDISRYKQSFGLRYQLLLFAAGVWFIYVIIYNIVGFLKRHPPNQYGWGACAAIVLLCCFSIAYSIFSISFVFWIPKFSGDALSNVCQTFFNIAEMPSKEYLSGVILNLYQMNSKANAAFAAGSIGLLNTVFLYKSNL